MKKLLNVIIPVLLVLVAFILSTNAWKVYMNGTWTRDARVMSEIVKIAPQVSGEVVNIYVKDNQEVKKGDLLFEINAKDYINTLNQNKANVNKAKSLLKQAQNIASRDVKLPKKLISEEQVTSDVLLVKQREAELESAKVQLKQAKLDLKRTKIYAVEDGFITNLTLRIGNYVSKSQTIATLIEKNSFYIIGYFEETKIPSLHPKDKAIITSFSKDKIFYGEIEGIGRGIVNQSSDNSGLLPNVQPTIPWVRLAQRVPVRIRITSDLDKLRLIYGTTVSVEIPQE